MDHSYSSSSKSNGTSTPAMKPLTERQQMALLLQMTAEDNLTPVRKRTKEVESSHSTPRSINRRNERGETPLHIAAIRGDAPRVRSLIAQGADVHTTDFAGWTPLHEAANRGHFSVARELLRSGARVDATGMDGVTPLHDAAVNGHENIVALLLRFGANPSLKTTSLKTAQDLAGSPQVVRLLAQQQGFDDEENITDENSPVDKMANNSMEQSWKKKRDYPKSRRSLQMEIDVINSAIDEMDSGAPVTNPNTSEEGKDGKAEAEGENSSSLNQTQASENPKGQTEEGTGHKEADASGEAQSAQKRPAETEDDNDDEGKRKRRKGDETKETKGRAASSIRGKDRKSPNTIQTETPSNDSDEDKKSNEPKVPPLKIVLSNSSEADTNVRSKNSNGRGSLAYVVSSNEEKNENSNGSSDKGDERSKDSTDGEKNSSSSSNGGRVTRSSQRAAASAAHSAPTSGQNSANQSPTSSPTQNQTNQTNAPSPADASETVTESQPATVNSATTTVNKVEETKEKSNEDAAVEVHPRKRKLRPREAEPTTTESTPTAGTTNTTNTQASSDTSAVPVVITNCYDMYFSIRKQIERRHRNLLPVQPKPPQGFKDYLMNRCTYVIAGNAASRLSVPVVSPPPSLPPTMRDLFAEQEKERYRLRMQHLIEKEKLVLSVEQEILRVHGRAARALANQALPFSVCTLLKDQEVYSALTPEQEEKDRNARSRYNGRLFLSWLQDVDDKWEKIKESMLLRHHNEAESLHAVQRMDWEWKIKEMGLCEPQNKPVIDEVHVPMVNVSDDFDLLPA